MKKSSLNFYEQPNVDVVDIVVEQGFAATGGGGGLTDGGTDPDGGDGGWGDFH